MSFREFIEELKIKLKEGNKYFILEIDGKRKNMGSLKANIETLGAVYELGYREIDFSDFFIETNENGQVIATNNIPF